MPARTIQIPVATLSQNRNQTFLVSDSAASSGTISVKNISGFAINQILILGDFGGETSEVIKTHAATAPTGSTVTLAANTAQPHAAYTRVTILAYDQVEVSYCATLTGAKVVLTTTGIQADTKTQFYDDITYTSGYYFYRFKNSITSTFSDYSDAIPYGGESFNTVAYITSYALERNNTKIGGNLTDTFIFKEINSCLRYIVGKRKKWSQLQSFGYTLGQSTTGIRSFALPSDIYETKSNKSILSVRNGSGPSLTYVDKKEFDDLNYKVHNTTVRTQALAGDTSLLITNSFDFDDTGTVSVFISGTQYEITYTGVTRNATTGVLTGIPVSGDGAITVTIPVSTNVWENIVQGSPTSYTVYGGNLLIHPVPDADSDNLNVVIDYWKGPQEVNSYGDVVDVFRADMVQDWLTWAIRSQLINKGQRDMNDSDYVMFEKKLHDAETNERTGQKYKWSVKVSGIDLSRSYRIKRNA